VKKLVQRLTSRIVSEMCYWICEHLDGYTERTTTCTKLAAGEAIAVSCALDWKRALTENHLPGQIRSSMATFSPEDWREVMSIASDDEWFMEGDLKRPEWEHLRRKPIT
jgi:hypothetical protein